MKKITLKSLTLTNFRGENRTTAFNPAETTIFGRNKLGKSRHFDAFLWLLFGKDKEGRDNYEVKTRINGEELHEVECSVVGVLDIDGEEIILKRELSEKWVKPRGETERIFKGNETLCWWNNVPVQVSEYNNRVKAIVEEDIFKMITNPKHFFGLKWQDQRDMLFQIVGTTSDQEIASSKAEFVALLDKLSGKSLADFKAELSARKKRLKSELNEIQPRIDQTQKLMPETSDFSALEEELAGIEADIATTDKAISDIAERTRQQYEAVQERQSKINALKSQRQQVLFDAQSKAKEEAFNANSNRRELQERINVVKREIHGYVQDENSANTQLEKLHKQIQDLTSKSDTLRSEWYKENEVQFNGETTCHCCGQELPESMKEEAREHFNKHKQGILEEITSKGKAYKAEIECANRSISEVEQDKNNAISGAKVKEEELHALEEQLATLSEVKQVEIIPDNIKEYSDLTKQIADLEATLEAGTEKVDTSEYQERKKELSRNRDEVKAKLADRERIEQFKKQIADLEAKGKDLAQQIADAEREEYTIAQFNKAKIEDSEKRINELFQSVKFKLSDYNIEDYKKENPIECCIPIVDGVYYSTSNTASQVNAGLDIINIMSRFFGITAPIFIDNREGVNDIIPVEAQIINLVVTESDYELVIK